MPIDFESIQNLTPELQRAFRNSLRAEAKPLEQMQERKAKIDNRLNLLNDVIGKVQQTRELLPGLNTPLAIREFRVDSADPQVVVGTADKSTADFGEHMIEVMQLASSASAMSNRFEDKDQTKVGSGYFVFAGPDGSKEVFIDNENSTLQGIAEIVNGAGVGLKASVVNDVSEEGTKYRLLFTAKDAGAGNVVEYPEFYFVDGQEDFYIDQEKPAQNAKIRYQGFELETPSNEVKELIRGVTLNLKGLNNPGKPIAVDIAQDVPKTTVKVKDLVDKVNSVLGFIQEQNKLDEKSDASKTLGGDYGIRMVENRLRNTIQAIGLGGTGPGSQVQILSDIGIEFKKDGLLKFDEKKFENQLNKNFDEVVAMLTGDGLNAGFIPRLSSVLTSAVAPGGGVLSNQRDNYKRQVQKATEEMAKKEKDIEDKAERLKMKLAKVQGAFTKLQTQQGYMGASGGGAAGAAPAQGPSPAEGPGRQ